MFTPAASQAVAIARERLYDRPVCMVAPPVIEMYMDSERLTTAVEPS